MPCCVQSLFSTSCSDAESRVWCLDIVCQYKHIQLLWCAYIDKRKVDYFEINSTNVTQKEGQRPTSLVDSSLLLLTFRHICIFNQFISPSLSLSFSSSLYSAFPFHFSLYLFLSLYFSHPNIFTYLFSVFLSTSFNLFPLLSRQVANWSRMGICSSRHRCVLYSASQFLHYYTINHNCLFVFQSILSLCYSMLVFINLFFFFYSQQWQILWKLLAVQMLLYKVEYWIHSFTTILLILFLIYPSRS